MKKILSNLLIVDPRSRYVGHHLHLVGEGEGEGGGVHAYFFNPLIYWIIDRVSSGGWTYTATTTTTTAYKSNFDLKHFSTDRLAQASPPRKTQSNVDQTHPTQSNQTYRHRHRCCPRVHSLSIVVDLCPSRLADCCCYCCPRYFHSLPLSLLLPHLLHSPLESPSGFPPCGAACCGPYWGGS